MSFPWESIEGWGFVLSSHFYSEKQRPREQTEKPRSAKVLLGFFLFNNCQTITQALAKTPQNKESTGCRRDNASKPLPHGFGQ